MKVRKTHVSAVVTIVVFGIETLQAHKTGETEQYDENEGFTEKQSKYSQQPSWTLYLRRFFLVCESSSQLARAPFF